MLKSPRLLLSVLVLASGEALAAGHPVRVARDGSGAPHFFEVWNGSGYQPTILRGATSFDFAGPNDIGSNYGPLFQGLRNQGMNFVRMWMRPSDGMFSSNYKAGVGKVVLEDRNTDFTIRLRDILAEAAEKGLIVEVMLWDTSTQWHAANLVAPTSWATCFTGAPENCPNIHHPSNHIKSLSDPFAIDLDPGSIGKLEGPGAGFWFDTGNTEWMNAQRDYMTQVMNVVSQFDNVTVEVMNEAGRNGFNDGSVEWRKQTHAWLASEYPGFIYQSQSCGGEGLDVLNDIPSDQELRAYGRDNPGTVDMVSTHWFWTYDDAQEVYHQYRVLPGCNEGDFPLGTEELPDGELRVKRTAWGITMGGGAFSVEELSHPKWGDLGPRLMRAIDRFFNPVDDPNRPAVRSRNP